MEVSVQGTLHLYYAQSTDKHNFINLMHKLVLFFYVLLTVHLSISLDNDQLDAHLLYSTIRLLNSSTCSKHYMLIIRRLNFIDAASGIILSVSGRPVHRTATD